MEVMDKVYGVTMAEPGISQIVSVDMEQHLPKAVKLLTAAEIEDTRSGATLSNAT